MKHHALICGILICLAAVLSGCASSGGNGAHPSLAEETNAPAQASINFQPGSEEDFILNVGRRTFFKQSSAELDETARTTLEKQAQWLRQYPSWKAKLQGFADDPGSAAQQSALSQK